MSKSTMTRRNAQDGSSHAGKTADASWMTPPADDDVGHGDAINFPPLNFFEKAAHSAVNYKRPHTLRQDSLAVVAHIVGQINPRPPH